MTDTLAYVALGGGLLALAIVGLMVLLHRRDSA